MTPKRTDVAPFEYVPANVPFYPPSKKWGVVGDGIKRMQKPLSPALSRPIVPAKQTSASAG